MRLSATPMCLGAILALVTTPALAADPAVTIKSAWTHAAGKGDDTTLYMTLENAGAEDAIIRVRCDAANFTEMRTVDRGEGFPSARSVKAIPVAAQGETLLVAEGFNVRLLQLSTTLTPGNTFDCALRLRGGGQPKVSVAVRPPEPGAE